MARCSGAFLSPLEKLRFKEYYLWILTGLSRPSMAHQTKISSGSCYYIAGSHCKHHMKTKNTICLVPSDSQGDQHSQDFVSSLGGPGLLIVLHAYSLLISVPSHHAASCNYPMLCSPPHVHPLLQPLMGLHWCQRQW